MDDPTIFDITYIGRHTCWETLPIFTHQVRLTPGMGLEGPSDGFSWGKYGQMDMLGGKYPRYVFRTFHYIKSGYVSRNCNVNKKYFSVSH
jgi:hypothetical protein